jgi:hypothetical protein
MNLQGTFAPCRLCLAKIKSACEINNIQRHRVTCYMDENRLVRSFGEGYPYQDATFRVSASTIHWNSVVA